MLEPCDLATVFHGLKPARASGPPPAEAEDADSPVLTQPTAQRESAYFFFFGAADLNMSLLSQPDSQP